MPRGNFSGAEPAVPGAIPPSTGSAEYPANFLVVAIGASAGGLEACGKFLGTLPASTGMAYIVVQHLDPAHGSLLVDLLAGHTSMQVCQAAEDMAIEPDHVYVIAPGTFLSVARGALHVTQIPGHRVVRLPLDFLLLSMADALHARAACIVLSGSGSDGSAGLVAIANRRGFVIVQERTEAGYDGMPRAAIETGRANRILPIAQMHQALEAHRRAPTHIEVPAPAVLSEIVELLRATTAHDFRLYKHGTLSRRIERRMAMAGTVGTSMQAYLALLKGNAKEIELLAADLLINVTAFFRDQRGFDFLAASIIPGIVRDRQIGKPIRIWVAGCSTGQEAYSLAMLFREHLEDANIRAELQIFASDADPAAIAIAREGRYPATIVAEVSEPRLARFFVKEDSDYRVSPELRAAVVFTVQDILSDPPFSHLDMLSCRNVMIYMQPEAQSKAIGLFHFSLRPGGVLLLGSSETLASSGENFDIVSDAERVYRQTARSSGSRYGFSANSAKSPQPVPAAGQERMSERRTSIGELCERLVLDSHAPAAVLINRKYDCLYSLGPTGRYLHVPHGAPTQNLLAMVPDSTRIGLRAAVHQAIVENARVVTVGGALVSAVPPWPSISMCVRRPGEARSCCWFVSWTMRNRELSRNRTPSRTVRGMSIS